MTQRKPTKQRTGKRPAAPAKGAGRRGSGGVPPGKPPKGGKPGKPGKSIVNQKQTPWGLILTLTLVVLFAAGVIT